MEPMYSENVSDVFIPNAHGSVKKASKLYFFLVDLALDLARKSGKVSCPRGVLSTHAYHCTPHNRTVLC